MIGFGQSGSYEAQPGDRKMNDIVLADEHLRQLEKQFGPAVRYMGPWNSDGTFGYCTVQIATLEKVANTIQDPTLSQRLQQLKGTPDSSTRFIELLHNYGAVLIAEIVAAHHQRFHISWARSAANVM